MRPDPEWLTTPTTTSTSSRLSLQRGDHHQAAGRRHGKTDLITMHFGYLPLMAEGEPLEPINTSPRSTAPRSRSSSNRTPSHNGNLMGAGIRSLPMMIRRW
jgi:hypothetical protein